MDKSSPQFKRQIELEYRKMRQDENRLHNKPLHEHILATWKRESPKMWAELEKNGMTASLAYVSQQRMWDHQEMLMADGMAVTDAREIAEREHLMLQPEAQDQLIPA